ncbi:hypothetical protein N9B94_04965, partial [Verrucomicrobia bacterium]|nr:hypothetical protein [Verrucomicrobiota bacterium]
KKATGQLTLITDQAPGVFSFTESMGDWTVGFDEGSTINELVAAANADPDFPFHASPAPAGDGSSIFPNANIDIPAGVNFLTKNIGTDQRILLGGEFVSVEQNSRGKLAKVWRTGSIDTNFLNNVVGFNNDVLVTQIDRTPGIHFNKILVGGSFTNFNGSIFRRLVRLNPDGTVDSSFQTGSGANDSIHAIAIDGKSQIYIGGLFTLYNGVNRSGIARLRSDGSLDTSFAVGTGALGGGVYALEFDENGDLYVGGDFTGFNGLLRERYLMVRLKALDGSVDTGFNQWENDIFDTPAGRVNAIEVLSNAGANNNNVVVGGSFTFAGGAPADFLIQVDNGGNLEGIVPGTFLPEVDGVVNDLISDPWGAANALLVVGKFSSVGGQERNNIARVLDTDGSIDVSFNQGQGANDEIFDADIHPNSPLIVIGGAFTQYDGKTANYFAVVNDGNNDATIGTELSFLFTDVDVNEDINNTPSAFFDGGDAINKAMADVVLFGPNNDFRLISKLNGTGINGIEVEIVAEVPADAPSVLYDAALKKLTLGVVSGVTTSDALKTAIEGDAIADLAFTVADVTGDGDLSGNIFLGAIMVIIERDGRLENTETVDVVVNVTSTASTMDMVPGLTDTKDYLPFVGTGITFVPGQSSATLSIPIFDKPNTVGSKVLVLDLMNNSEVMTTLNIQRITFNIQNTDSFIGFEFDSYSVSEESSAAVIRAFREGSLLNPASVNYSTISGGTAVAGSDYTPVT